MLKSLVLRVIIFFSAIVTLSCSSPDIRKTAPNTYSVFKSFSVGMSAKSGQIKAAVIRDAIEYAQKKGGVALPVSIIDMPTESAKNASIEYHFRVVPLEAYPGVTVIMKNMAYLYENAFRIETIEDWFKKTINLYGQAIEKRNETVADIVYQLALLNKTAGFYSEADPLFNEALMLFKRNAKTEIDPDVATIMNNQGVMYVKIGRYGEAESLFKSALKLYRKTFNQVNTYIASTMSNLATLYKEIGRYDEAVRLLERVLDIYEKMHEKDHLEVATTMNNLAGLYLALGLEAKAGRYFKQALKIRKTQHSTYHPDVASSLNNMGLLEMNRERYAKSESYFKQAIDMRRKLGERDSTAGALIMHNLGLLYYKMGRHIDAESLYKEALSIRNKHLGKYHPDVASSMHNLAILYSVNDRHSESLFLMDRALSIALQGGEPEVLCDILHSYSRILRNNDKFDGAIFFGKLAVNTIQQMRVNVKALSKETQRRFLDTKEEVYKDLAEFLISQGRLAEAFQVLAMLKEEEYFDFIRRDASNDVRQTKVPFTEKEELGRVKFDRFNSRLALLNRELGQLKQKSMRTRLTGNEKRRLQYLQEKVFPVATERFFSCLKELSNMRLMSRKRRDELMSRNLKSLPGLKGTLRQLGDGVLMVHFVSTRSKLVILLTTPYGAPLVREYPIGATELNKKITAFRDVVSNPIKDPLPLAKELYTCLFRPVINDMRQAKAKVLMISLDGAMRYLPIAALHDGRKYLVESFQLAIFTEATRDKIKDPVASRWRIAGLGLTKKLPDFMQLPAVKDELEGIVRKNADDLDGVFDGVVYLDENFNARTLQDAINKAYPVLHIASHFCFKPGNESHSFLILGDGTRLSLLEIRNRFDFPDVDLLTLSACNTAMGSNARGREIEGLGTLAQIKGARGVLATLWPVADRSTGLFMKTMYALKSKQALTKAEALQKTQIKFIRSTVGHQNAASEKQGIGYSNGRDNVKSGDGTDKMKPYAHPYYWAPFILMGNWL